MPGEKKGIKVTHKPTEEVVECSAFEHNIDNQNAAAIVLQRKLDVQLFTV